MGYHAMSGPSRTAEEPKGQVAVPQKNQIDNAHLIGNKASLIMLMYWY